MAFAPQSRSLKIRFISHLRERKTSELTLQGLRTPAPPPPWIFRFLASGTRDRYPARAAAEDTALLGSRPANGFPGAAAGPYGTSGVRADAALFIRAAGGPNALNPGGAGAEPLPCISIHLFCSPRRWEMNRLFCEKPQKN